MDGLGLLGLTGLSLTGQNASNLTANFKNLLIYSDPNQQATKNWFNKTRVKHSHFSPLYIRAAKLVVEINTLVHQHESQSSVHCPWCREFYNCLVICDYTRQDWRDFPKVYLFGFEHTEGDKSQ